jgi:hypothetical protein
MSDCTKRIESWFRAHEDGEFCQSPLDCPFELANVSSSCRTLIYTTKRHCVRRLIEVSGANARVGMIGRYGLPCKDDVERIVNLKGDRMCIFLGDADPPDLLVFAWIRAHLPISWWGVSDAFLAAFGVEPTTNRTVRLSDSELLALAEVNELCPDFRDLLGPKCASLLDDGRKLELEGAVNFATVGSRICRQASGLRSDGACEPWLWARCCWLRLRPSSPIS